MRVREILEDAEANWPIIAQRIAKGDWRGAILMGALSNKKELYPYLNDDQKRVLNYAVKIGRAHV